MKLRSKKIIILLIVTVMLFANFTINGLANEDATTTNNIDNELIFSLPIKSGEGTVAYTDEAVEMERFGPESFSVSDEGTFYILDSVDKQVEIFDISGNPIDTIKLPENESYYDIEIKDNGSMVILTYKGNILEYNKNGTLINQSSIELKEARDINFNQLYKNKNGDIVIRDLLNYKEISIDTKKVNDNLAFMDIRKDKNKTIISYQGNNIVIDYDYQSAGTYPLNQIQEDDIIILEKEVLIGKKIYLENRISKYNKGKKTGTALAEPISNYEIIPNKYIYSSKNKKTYQMVLNKDSIDIYELKFAKFKLTNIDNTLINEISGEPQLKSNNNTASLLKKLNDPYNAYHVGTLIAEYEWDFDYDTMLTPYDINKHTKPPQHLNERSEEGYQMGVPYKWGGFDGTSQFQNSIDGDKTAGDIDWTKVVGTTAGVDCSGFISRDYGFDYKLSTSTIPSHFSKIEWNDIDTGDIANIVGVHVWMYEDTVYDENDNIKGYYTIESTTDGDEDKAKYWYRSLEDVTADEYIPMRINKK